MNASPLAADPWRTQTVEIGGAIDELDGIATYRLAPVPTTPDACRFTPGQFNMLYLPGVGEVAISMSGDPAATDAWIHTIRVAGNVTKTFAALPRGSRLGLRGPFGVGWPVESLRGGDVVLVTGGVGLAPIRPLICHLLRHRGDYGRIWLINGARTPDSLLFQREYDDWRHSLTLQLTVDRAIGKWTGHVGVVTLLVDRLRLTRPEQTHVITCGPEVMMKFAAVSALRRDVAPERIWVSLERNMQCAAGLCGHCQLGPAFICKDGPVFRYDRILPYLNVEAL
jgi:NAD(P)H-flavin reductase